MVVALVLLNIVLTILSVWGAINAFNNTTSMSDVIGINVHKEVVLYLIPIVVAGVSALVKSVKPYASVCAFVITMCGAYVLYDTWGDTLGSVNDCFSGAGTDIKKQERCAEKYVPKR
jgi:uncharacterized membrane protein